MKKLLSYIIDTIVQEYKFIIFMILLLIIFEFPLNYYIIVGGGTSDVSSRIKVDDNYNSKGSFNISYVEELQGNVGTYLLSYIIPTWDREDANNYKYSDKEDIKDIEFRSDLDLLTSNGNATYWAYTLAGKKIKKTDYKLYVITVFDGYDTPLKVGDEILSINNNTYESIDEYREYLQTTSVDDEVEVKIKRNNKEKIVKSKMYKYKDRLIMGVGLQIVNKYSTQPKVNIKFRNSESGPSGGLISTLEIYNQLTKKDLTHGLKITGTGTIEDDGSIGEIGGVEYKLLGASQDKSDIFLVPSGDNYKTALKYKKDKKLKIKIIEVKNIQDAISKLEGIEVN
ncbi:MAG: PDZ domain-containing protein [Bacilli bacterium]|nr:PDZ domain-containing protein [Bacilli bacterium]